MSFPRQKDASETVTVRRARECWSGVGCRSYRWSSYTHRMSAGQVWIRHVDRREYRQGHHWRDLQQLIGPWSRLWLHDHSPIQTGIHRRNTCRSVNIRGPPPAATPLRRMVNSSTSSHVGLTASVVPQSAPFMPGTCAETMCRYPADATCPGPASLPSEPCLRRSFSALRSCHLLILRAHSSRERVWGWRPSAELI